MGTPSLPLAEREGCTSARQFPSAGLTPGLPGAETRRRLLRTMWRLMFRHKKLPGSVSAPCPRPHVQGRAGRSAPDSKGLPLSAPTGQGPRHPAGRQTRRGARRGKTHRPPARFSALARATFPQQCYTQSLSRCVRCRTPARVPCTSARRGSARHAPHPPPRTVRLSLVLAVFGLRGPEGRLCICLSVRGSRRNFTRRTAAVTNARGDAGTGPAAHRGRGVVGLTSLLHSESQLPPEALLGVGPKMDRLRWRSFLVVLQAALWCER